MALHVYNDGKTPRKSSEDSSSPAVSSSSKPTRPARDPIANGELEIRLLSRMASRDPEALSELYRIYANPLFSFAMKSLGDQFEAEETLQDAFVRIWDKAPQYDPKLSKPFTWAVMITRGLCLDRLRKRSRKRRLHTLPLADHDDGATSTDASIADLFFSETTRIVKNALQELPQEERRCVRMAIFGEITHYQIAEELNQPLGTVKSRIRRGIIKLRDLLKDHDR